MRDDLLSLCALTQRTDFYHSPGVTREGMTAWGENSEPSVPIVRSHGRIS